MFNRDVDSYGSIVWKVENSICFDASKEGSVEDRKEIAADLFAWLGDDRFICLLYNVLKVPLDSCRTLNKEANPCALR